jgi:hypothetical protein
MDLIDVIEPMETADMESTSPRKIVLWGQDDLLSQSITRLFLESNMTWDVIRVTRDGDVGDLIKEVERIKPEVVILCEDKADEKSTLPSLLINEQHCPKVVTVSLKSNLMQVYSKHNIILQGASELLSIVESGNYPNCTSGKEAKSE